MSIKLKKIIESITPQLTEEIKISNIIKKYPNYPFFFNPIIKHQKIILNNKEYYILEKEIRNLHHKTPDNADTKDYINEIRKILKIYFEKEFILDDSTIFYDIDNNIPLLTRFIYL
jgi:hypothetical protein